MPRSVEWGISQAQVPRFDVASVKPSAPGTLLYWNVLPGGRFAARGISTAYLVTMAYQTHEADVVGLPRWSSAATSILKRSRDRALSLDQARLAVRDLLHDRWGLVIHVSSRVERGYALKLAGPDSKLKIAMPRLEDERRGISPGVTKTGEQLSGRDVAVSDLVFRPTNMIRMPVTDGTGLSGRYDFLLEWTPRPEAPPSLSSQESTPEPEGPSLADALQSQLGLKLNPQNINHDVVVVDKLEKPSAN